MKKITLLLASAFVLTTAGTALAQNTNQVVSPTVTRESGGAMSGAASDAAKDAMKKVEEHKDAMKDAKDMKGMKDMKADDAMKMKKMK